MSKEDLNRFINDNYQPTLGFLFLRQDKNSKKAPFGEIIINNIYKPEDIKPIWEEIIKRYEKNRSKTIHQVFSKIKDEDGYSKNILNVTKKFIMQKGYDDKKILESIKIKNNKLSGNSKLLWFSCSVIENFSCSNLEINEERISLHDYLQPFSPYRQSLAYLMPINNYFEFRKGMKKSRDYSIGEEAKEKAFDNLQKNFTSSIYSTSFKSFSEEAWRDLLCTVQFNYQNNENKIYKILMHLIIEKLECNDFELIDYDTEVKWQTNIDDSKRGGRLDAYLHLKNQEQENYKYYFEFKAFGKTLSGDKDVSWQPIAIKNNDFAYSRYFHNGKDKWFYIAVTENTNYEKLDNIISKKNYINLNWMEIFEFIMKSLYPQALDSVDKSLLYFLDFLMKK